ncbi:ABC transporter ATP-binding protein [Paenibacillus sp. CC-CFT747]|nr:ABC transporter ATP-binding protein [Paenibacillus sp. CC-CFT747]
MIQVEEASKAYQGQVVLDRVSLHVEAGCFYGIIGPNGSGKSTLLKLISGVEKVDGGSLRLDGREPGAYSRKELARWMAVLQQDAPAPAGFTVREVIEMGRYPYQNWLGEENRDPAPLIDRIMSRLELEPFAGRPVEHLSGGERQRVALGKTMAQEPRLLLLDEPTTFLDIGHQIQMMNFVRTWQQECGLTVVAVLHDLNLAAQYCERLLVLHEGRMAGTGSPAEILTGELVARVYGTEPIVLPHPVSGVPQILLQP